MINITNETRLTDSLERELMAQSIADQHGYNLVEDLKALFAKVRTSLGGMKSTTGQASQSAAGQAA